MVFRGLGHLEEVTLRELRIPFGSEFRQAYRNGRSIPLALGTGVGTDLL
jgi:hypothetical protein